VTDAQQPTAKTEQDAFLTPLLRTPSSGRSTSAGVSPSRSDRFRGFGKKEGEFPSVESIIIQRLLRLTLPLVLNYYQQNHHHHWLALPMQRLPVSPLLLVHKHNILSDSEGQQKGFNESLLKTSRGATAPTVKVKLRSTKRFFCLQISKRTR